MNTSETIQWTQFAFNPPAFSRGDVMATDAIDRLDATPNEKEFLRSYLRLKDLLSQIQELREGCENEMRFIGVTHPWNGITRYDNNYSTSFNY